jgi:hypothetical protein
VSEQLLLVAPCSHEAAKYAVEHWHYSGTLPVPPRVTLGVWERGRYIGAVVYSRGTAPAIGTPWGLTQSECCELTRVALTEHEQPVTAVVAASLRWLHEHNPGLRLVVSFADPYESHHGGIYQAGNWVYTGQSAPTQMYVERATGKRWHSRQVSSSGVRTQFGEARRVVTHAECDVIKLPGKHRYLYPLDKAMRRQLQRMGVAQPYPAPSEPALQSQGG